MEEVKYVVLVTGFGFFPILCVITAKEETSALVVLYMLKHRENTTQSLPSRVWGRESVTYIFFPICC